MSPVALLKKQNKNGNLKKLCINVIHRVRWRKQVCWGFGTVAQEVQRVVGLAGVTVYQSIKKSRRYYFQYRQLYRHS